MLSVATIVTRVLVGPFYKENTGFFLFLFFLLFGLMNARDLVLYHSSLMHTIVATGVGMGVAMLAALLYNYKCAAFVFHNLSRPENSFLINMQALPVRQQFAILFFCQVLLAAPVLLYLGTTIAIGLQQGFIVAAFGLVLFLMLSCAGSALLYVRKLNGTHKATLRLPLLFSGNYTKLPVLYPLHHLLHERKLALLIVKLFSCFVFYMVFIVNRDVFSINYFRLLFLLCATGHSMLVYYSFAFTEKQLAFTRNLPVSRTKRLLNYLLTYLLLLLLELCLLLVYSTGLMNWIELLQTFAIGPGQLLLLMAILYLPNMHLQRFGLFTCLVYLGLAVLLPSGVTIVLLAQVTIALAIFYSRYYKFELMNSE
ncbi:hypothetical protein H7F15_07635 [Pontibacter sp. Tf4]|uniref:hypothetical protein n=1 Tax=Pontibacter sp. Tf4 TaxID=2761620 RepID=UPI0016275368|nr:hypothetical protein [Pontibacter sp. Tf4]MBB6610903.1 hypothetical protein [Pontibacter sp. Tf4]